MNKILLIGIGLICIFTTFCTTYALVNTYKDQELTKVKIQYESEILNLNTQLTVKENQLSDKTIEINTLNGKLDEIDYNLVSDLDKFDGTWELTDGNPTFFYSKMQIGWRYNSTLFKPAYLTMGTNEITAFFGKVDGGKMILFDAGGDIPFMTLYPQYASAYSYVFKDNNHLWVSSPQNYVGWIQANYTRIS